MYQSVESTFLRSGTVFQGIQQSGRSTYQVKVKFHYVDLQTSFLCGFLRIQGLSLDNPSLTTYFEAEIIGPHYSFQTRRPEWGATERTDLDHWTKFPALKQTRPGGKSIKNGWDKAYKKPLEKEYVFMRWKVDPSFHTHYTNDLGIVFAFCSTQ
jgi:glucose-induced degradation protein 4